MKFEVLGVALVLISLNAAMEVNGGVCSHVKLRGRYVQNFGKGGLWQLLSTET